MAVDRDKVLQAAQKLVERKRYDKAVVEYQKLVAEDPKDVRTLLKIGDLYLKMEEYAEAITTYERVGQFYSLQGFALKAIAVYKQIREIILKHVPHLEDRFGHIVPRLAEIYTQLGLTSDALAAYDEVATRLQRAGRDRDAIDVFRKIVDLDPNNPLPYLRLAEALIRVKDFDNAIKRFGTAAEILLKLGRRDDALKVVERLLQHRPEAKFARMAAEIYLDRGGANDGMAALTKLQLAFKENPKDLETLTLLARAFDLLGQPAKAIEVQKESARIAKEAGRIDQFAALVASLLSRAPGDEQVKALAAQLVPPSADPRSSIDVEIEEDVVIIDTDSEVEADQEEPDAVVPLPRGSQVAVDPFDPAALARQIIGKAEALRRRNIDDAVAVLRNGVQNLPSARNLREKLSDFLIEAGDQDGAIAQMLDFAQYLANESDVEAAARVLDEVLLLEPGHAQATEMLGVLGYAVQEEYADAAVLDAEEIVEQYTGEIHTGELYDPNAPLPSWDIEEPALVSTLDDPFANEPLPSFPIDDEETRFIQVPTPSAQAAPVAPVAPAAPVPAATHAKPPKPAPPRAAPQAPVDDLGSGPGHAAPPVAAVAAAPAAHQPAPRRPENTAPLHVGRDAAFAGPSARPPVSPVAEPPPPPMPSQRAEALDEDALDEVEFFARQGEFEEARNLLEEQLARLPNHPLLLERLREVDYMAAQARASADNKSGTRAVPREDEDKAFDIAEHLGMLDEMPAGFAAPSAPEEDPRQISVETVFEQFKAGVAAQISESDAATHYDLGVAYKEMGLYTDAISEFELASRDPGRECVCQSMIGIIYLQLGNIDSAIDALIRGLHSGQRTPEQEVALTYEIANAYETRGNPDQALYYFQRVYKASPGYHDPRGTVADRVRRLEHPKPTARAVGAEMHADEFDAVFDDLFAPKLP